MFFLRTLLFCVNVCALYAQDHTSEKMHTLKRVHLVRYPYETILQPACIRLYDNIDQIQTFGIQCSKSKKIVGYMVCEFEPLTENLNINLLEIYKEHRRKGYGYAVFQHIFNHMRIQHQRPLGISLLVMSTNEAARGLYQKVGFKYRTRETRSAMYENIMMLYTLSDKNVIH